jgi:MinD-like ATPase involved in chromosome partitioning or flagellar assembly
MARIISIHSFRGGTGKSNTTANIAALLARQGLTVGVVDTDIQSPGIHVLFGLRGSGITHSLNDYIWGRCAITETARRVLTEEVEGPVFLIPSSMNAEDIVHVLRQGFDTRLLTEAFRDLIDALALDVLLIDTHPGLNEETLFSLAMSTTLLVVMRPDQQDYEGTGVTIKVAQSLEVPSMMLLVNKAPPSLDPEAIRARVENAYGCKVAAVLPHDDRMMELASAGIFALRYPDHTLTCAFRRVVAELLETEER